jgi:glycosyltransferase involved in cell wall biosynthesis
LIFTGRYVTILAIMRLPEQDRTAQGVVFLAYNFPPMGGGGVQRSAKFVKYLPQFGWVPTVLAADDPHYWARDDTLLGDISSDITVKRLSPTRPHLLYHLLSKITSEANFRRIADSVLIPDDRVLWAIRAALRARALVRARAIRVIYTTSPPHSTHISGLILKRMTGLPWVADFRDPWTRDFRYDPPTRWVRRAHTACERTILNKADRVICITESARQKYIEDFGIEPQRLVTIYNGFDASDFPLDPGRRRAPARRIVITHSGSFYGVYFPELFFRALAAALDADPDLGGRVSVRFVGVMEKAIEEKILAILPGRSEFSGYISHPEAVKAMAESDINLIALPVDREASYHVPGKLFEYLAAGRPILAVAPRGETARIIESAGAGMVLSDSTISELSDALRRTIRVLAEAKGRAPDAAVIGEFERRNLTRRLARVFDNAIGR